MNSSRASSSLHESAWPNTYRIRTWAARETSITTTATTTAALVVVASTSLTARSARTAVPRIYFAAASASSIRSAPMEGRYFS